MAAAHENPHSPEKVTERYLAIIEHIARDLGLSGKISINDIQSAYYSQLMGQMDEAAYWEAQDKLQRFKAKSPAEQPNLNAG